MKRTTRMATTLLVAAGLLAACGTDSGGDGNQTGDTPETTVAVTRPPVADPGLDVCTLFENVDVEGLLGETPGPVEPDVARCFVLPESEESTALVAVGLQRPAADAYRDAEELLGSDGAVEGLGDEAFFTGTWLHVLAGDMYIDLQVVNGAGEPVTEDEMVEAMRLVLTNVGMDA